MEAITAVEQIEIGNNENIIYFDEVVEDYSEIIWFPSEEVLILTQSLRQGDEVLAFL